MPHTSQQRQQDSEQRPADPPATPAEPAAASLGNQAGVGAALAKLRTRFTPRRVQRFVASAVVLAVVSGLAFYASHLLRFAGRIEPASWAIFLRTAPVVIAVRLVAMAWLGQRQAWSRSFSFHDLVVLVKSITVGTAGVMLVDAMLLPGLTIPRSIVLLDWGTTLVALAAINSVPRLVHDLHWNPLRRRPSAATLIVGANAAGEDLLRALRRNPALSWRPVGFIDTRTRYVGRTVGGLPVMGGLGDVPRLVRKHRVACVLITAGQLPGAEVRRLMDSASSHGFQVRVLPSYEQLLRDDVAIKPREVAIADLLQRA
ncbi:MAG: hypothetical protein AAF790_13435, partial [Planctomycetota bacterium]